MKRLHDVVVSAGAKPVYFVLPAVARRQNQYRIGLALFPELTDEIEPGDFRQPKIDDREVDRVLERKVEPLPAVGGLLDTEAGLGKLAAERFAQRCVCLLYTSPSPRDS